MSSENVRVIVRCRPMNKNETNQKKIVKIADLCVKLENASDPAVPSKSFTFDSVYDDKAPTEAIYNDICYPLVESVLEGFNATIFAYGQTGCGKSFTMSNPPAPGTSMLKSAQRGIISRSFEHIFEAISVASESKFLAFVSYLEIYNENIRDLLSNNRGNLPLKESTDGGIVVQNLSQHPVQNCDDCERLLELGNNNRAVGETNMNATSSRSHSIFSICVEQVHREGGGGAGDDLDLLKLGPTVKRGKLNLVDLAGSERQGKTGATGDRLKEATKINLSLSALGNVISALVDGKTKHIPYRDSKLTRLLQDSLGGNTKTLMIACISPAESNYDETLSTLRYANRAKNISNKPQLNEDPTETIIRQYREEILKLKDMLNQSSGAATPDVGAALLAGGDNTASIELERERLRKEYEEKRLEMERLNEDQKREKENLKREMENLRVYYENKLNCNGGGKEAAVVITPTKLVKDNGPEKKEERLNKEQIYQRINEMKGALIGGERATDVNLMEKRKKKKIEADYRQRVLKDALDRITADEERELLQGHYSDIQQELAIKTDALKARRQKIRVQEREIEDLHSEFQLERADYLESIRKLEQSVKLYQQLLDKALPILRRDNRFWDVDDIRSRSEWSDDAKRWMLPEDALQRVKLPPAIAEISNESYTAPGRMQHSSTTSSSLPQSPNVDEASCDESDFLMKKLQNTDNQLIVESYFRPKRARELLLRNTNSSNGKGPKNNMLNKMLTEPELFPNGSATAMMGRNNHVLPTNHNNFSAFAAKLKNF